MRTKTILFLGAALLVLMGACKSGDRGWHAKHAKKRKGMTSRQK